MVKHEDGGSKEMKRKENREKEKEKQFDDEKEGQGESGRSTGNHERSAPEHAGE
jgi:hypothetical protein